jgi:phosphate transport system permease protein
MRRPERSLQEQAKGGERSPKALVFLVLLWLAMFIAMTVLLVLIVTTLIDGASRLDMRLFTEYPSSTPARAGARPAILGSIWVIATTAVLAIPLASATVQPRFADKTRRFNRMIDLSVQTSRPSSVYGLLALAVLTLLKCRTKTGHRRATALGLLILPVIIIATREALRSVPRKSARILALGHAYERCGGRRCPAPGIATERFWRCRGHWARQRPSSCWGVAFVLTERA